jgi:HD-GYP domain-containing protein (c-di-GMP phosphodiesterase class II)
MAHPMSVQESVPIATQGRNFSQRLEDLHVSLRQDLAHVDRVAVALYSPHTNMLRTFAHSTFGAAPLWHYEASLDEVPSLRELVRTRSARLLQDLAVFSDSPTRHSRYLIENGFHASYTDPIFEGDRFMGFVFVNTRHPMGFGIDTVPYLMLVTRIVSLMLRAEVDSVRMLVRSLEATKEITSLRDRETGEHLARIGEFSRLMCLALGDELSLDDEYCTLVAQLSPLHDIGKIAIPDSILAKPGPLSREEMDVMKTHASRGALIVDRFFSATLYDSLERPLQILRNIVLHHHEAWDGTGYPVGLAGEAIPIEARIVRVVDVYDALTHRRRYKDKWTHAASVAYLREHSGSHFDPCCVAAFLRIEDAFTRARAAAGDEE